SYGFNMLTWRPSLVGIGLSVRSPGTVDPTRAVKSVGAFCAVAFRLTSFHASFCWAAVKVSPGLVISCMAEGWDIFDMVELCSAADATPTLEASATAVAAAMSCVFMVDIPGLRRPLMSRTFLKAGTFH